jgi:hypothetical protein
MFMKLLTALVLAPLAASAATLVIPASGSGPGANGSRWQSEVTLHNSSFRPVTVTLTFHDANGGSQSTSEVVAARHTTSISDIVASRFQHDAATGAIIVDAPDVFDSRVVNSYLAVTSRTFNHSPGGDFGQDIPATPVADALGAGDTGIIAGARDVSNSRMNFGIYSVDASVVHWQLIRADGAVAADAVRSYAAGVQEQYSADGATLLSAPRQNDDVIYAQVVGGHAIVYGSTIDGVSGDPTYVAGVRLRLESAIDFVGVDTSHDGQADVLDADHDGVVDAPVDVFISAFPSFLHFIGSGPNGEKVTFSLVDPIPDTVMLTDDAILEWSPSVLLRGQSFTLRVLATTGSDSEVLTIPIRFR